MKKKLISFDPSSIDDRREVFSLVCGLLNLKESDEAKKMKLTENNKGFNITSDHLYSFFFLKGVELVSADKEDQTSIRLVELSAGGNRVIDNPEMINSTSVDKEIDDKYTGPETEEEDEDEVKLPDDDEDDELPF